MNLELNGQLFIVGGATSGFGRATAEKLLDEGATVIVVARGEEELKKIYQQNEHAEIFAGDLTDEECLKKLQSYVGNRILHGMFINAGGPPAKTVLETSLQDWDDAYKKILRWKVAITQNFVPAMMNNKYGRIVYVESSSVKQPLENLVLSNSLRMAVVGMVKTLSAEIAKSGVTLNIMAPGSHNTPAIERIYKKKSEQTGISYDKVRATAINQIPVGALGEATDFASLAVWLLSPHSRYITGQTITIDGGMVKSSFG